MHLFDIQTFIYVSRIVSMHLVMSWMISRKHRARTWWEEDLRTSVQAQPFRTTEAWVFNRWNLRCPGGKLGSEILQNAGKLKENNPRYNIRIHLLFVFWWKIKPSFLKKNVFFGKKGFPILAFAISFVQLGNDLPDVGIFIPCLFKGRSPHDQWRKSWLFIRLGQVLPWLPRLKKHIFIYFSPL